ncbi:hypothetical protein M9H77_23890 [Catharanthus roseus]|uniref:Uncharacterized protein n=1 Tax=Catharanthus roseus TaxID=4058 RepID=A0ACC0AVT5_CATRO|nr:hypothetical protein M9H77_23890 [Catharanthus roseus]
MVIYGEEEKITTRGILNSFLKKDEYTKEKENDLEENERTKEMKQGDHFTCFNSPRKYLERRYFIESNSISCASPRVDDCDFNIAIFDSCVRGVEDTKSMEKELGPTLEDISISLSLNLSSLCYEVSIEEIKSLLNSYTFHLSLVIDMPFKELCYLWNSHGIATLVDKLSALFAYSLLSLVYLNNFPSIVPFNAFISNVARLLLLFERMDWKMNPFKGAVDGMTWKVQGTVELWQGPVTRAMA